MTTEPRELGEYQNDHDILIELRTEFRGMRTDIRDLKDGTSDKLGDHELRIRWLENRGWMLSGAVLAVSAVISYAISIFS